MTLAASLFKISGKTIASLQSTPWYSLVFASLISLMAPLKTYVYFMITLLIIDAFTSIYYQCKRNRPNYSNLFATILYTIESNKLRVTVEKMLFYIIGIILVFLFEKILLKTAPVDGVFNVVSLTNISVMLISMVELYSIMENISHITNNPAWLKIAKLFKKKVDEKTETPA